MAVYYLNSLAGGWSPPAFGVSDLVLLSNVPGYTDGGIVMSTGTGTSLIRFIDENSSLTVGGNYDGSAKNISFSAVADYLRNNVTEGEVSSGTNVYPTDVLFYVNGKINITASTGAALANYKDIATGEKKTDSAVQFYVEVVNDQMYPGPMNPPVEDGTKWNESLLHPGTYPEKITFYATNAQAVGELEFTSSFAGQWTSRIYLKDVTVGQMEYKGIYGELKNHVFETRNSLSGTSFFNNNSYYGYDIPVTKSTVVDADFTAQTSSTIELDLTTYDRFYFTRDKHVRVTIRHVNGEIIGNSMNALSVDSGNNVYLEDGVWSGSISVSNTNVAKVNTTMLSQPSVKASTSTTYFDKDGNKVEPAKEYKDKPTDDPNIWSYSSYTAHSAVEDINGADSRLSTDVSGNVFTSTAVQGGHGEVTADGMEELVAGTNTVSIKDMDGVFNVSVDNNELHGETASTEYYYLQEASTTIGTKTVTGKVEAKDDKGNPIYETDGSGQIVIDPATGKPKPLMIDAYKWETATKENKNLSEQERLDIYNAELDRIQKLFDGDGGEIKPTALVMTLTMKDNYFESAAIKSETVKLDRVRENSVMNVSTSGNILSYVHNDVNTTYFKDYGSGIDITSSHMFVAGLKWSDSSVVGNNKFKAVGVFADQTTLGRYDGTMNIAVNNNITQGNTEYVTARGFSGWNMTVTENIGGAINVEAMNNAFTCDWAIVYSSSLELAGIDIYNDMYVTGRVNSDISVVAGDGLDAWQMNRLYGISVGYNLRLYNSGESLADEKSEDGRAYSMVISDKEHYHGVLATDAITSDISVIYVENPNNNRYSASAAAISVGKALVSNSLATDSVDITGNITVAYRGGDLLFKSGSAIETSGTLNVRISGSIFAGYAVYASNGFDSTQRLAYEKYAEENDSWTPDTWNKYVKKSTFADTVEFAAGAVVDGNVELNQGKNEIIANTNATVNGLMSATGGSINFKFMLDGVAQDNAVITADNLDGSLMSTSTFTINMNNALVGTNATYVLYKYIGDDDTLSAAESNWTTSEKRVTFTYHGQTQEFVLKNLDKGFTVNFSDGASATVIYDKANSEFKVTTSKITSLAAFGSEFKALTLSSSNALKVSWTAHSKVLAVDNSGYQVEYWIYDENGNRGNSMMTTVLNTQLDYGANNSVEYIIAGVNPGQKVEYRVRYFEGIDSNYSQWSTLQTVNTDKLALPTLTMSGNTPHVASANESGAGITDAIALMQWGDATGVNATVKNYNVQYFITDKEITLTDAEFESGMTLEEKVMSVLAEKAANGELYEKTTSAPEVYVSGLVNRSFVYWRVQAVGYLPANKGEYIVEVDKAVSDWKLGEIFRVYDNDVTKPNFVERTDGQSVGKITYGYDRTDPKNVKIVVALEWMEATDSQSGVKQYVVEYKKSLDADWTNAQRVIIPKGTNPGSSYDYSYLLSLAGGEYNFRVFAVDYAGNQSLSAVDETIAYGNADVTPPEGKFLSFDAAVINTTWASAGTTEGGTTIVPPEGWFFDAMAGDTSGNGGLGGMGTTARQATAQTITLAWKDTYTDDAGVKYRVVFSDNIEDFSVFNGNYKSSNTFAADMAIIEPDATTGKKSMTIGNSIVGFDLGSVYRIAAANNGSVYWSIMAVDGNNNATGDWSGVNTFTITGEDYLTSANVNTTTDVSPSELSATKFDLNAEELVEKANSNAVQFKWIAANAFFGVADYIVTLNNKTNGKTYTYNWGRGDDGVTTDGTTGAPTTQYSWGMLDIVDGAYSWSVTADIANMDDLTTKGKDFVVDTIGPSWTNNDYGINLVRRAYSSDLVWNFATDLNGVGKYIIQYCALSGLTKAQINDPGYGWSAGVTVQGTSNTAVIPVYSTESYKIRVIAEDTYGNQTASSQIIFDATEKEELPSDIASAPVKIDASNPGSATEFVWSNAAVDQTVGQDDKADCFKVIANSDFLFSELKLDFMNVSTLHGSASKIKVSIYNADTGKKLKSYTVKAGYSALYYDINTAKLGTANLAVMLQSSNSKSVVYYGLDATLRKLPVNNADDTWKYNSYVEANKTVVGNTRTDVSNVSVTSADWVGKGDTVDYWKVGITAAGNYTFTLSIAEDAIDLNKVKLTLYRVKYASDGSEKSISSVVNVTLKGYYDKNTLKWTFAPVTTKGKLLAVGDYYVAVTAPSAKSGLGADYAVSVSGTAYIKGFTGDDVRTSQWVQDNAVTLNSGVNTIDGGNWVGFGDSVDYRKLNVTGSGTFQFTLGGGVSDKLKFALYQDLGNGKYKKIASFTTKEGGTSKEVTLEAGTYYTEVTATNAKKAGNTSYSLYSSGSYDSNPLQLAGLPAASDDTWQDAVEFSPVTSGDILAGFVGNGDIADFSRLNLGESGIVEFDASSSDTSKIDMALFDSNGTAIALTNDSGVWSSSIALSAGSDYYVGIEAADKDQSETSYNVAIGMKKA